MWYKIKEGKHRASPLSLGIHLGKTSESYEVEFTESCLYEPLDWEDDINKLVGWSYGMHHKNSIRIGWRPSRTKERTIDLFLYAYLNEVREIEFSQEVEINQKFKITLDVIDSDFKPTWGYNLGLFFGGNLPAPHDMKVWIKKLKKY